MNKTLQTTRSGVTLVCALLLGVAALAHGDEDHSAPTATATATLTLLPRIGVTTEAFELVAVLEPGRLLIHVDRADSNQPVPKAQLDVESAGSNTGAVELAPGLFALSLAQPLAAGAHALTFTIQTPDSGDLIAASLLVPPASVGQAPVGVSAAMATQPWSWLAGGIGLVLAGMSWALMRRRRAAGAASNPRNLK